ncbi:DegT/DnrJ/EryC1/StrS family aminotransferase [Labilibaculum antarcticum]|uniref:Aminotransferase DegT n=1 Tax=Labilibaculum antarcticum TaxID=1717717 RepID=A0A1Y1CE45_9BACT|nr:DegT/DnrJ/EryC1/StrS family aminotransferase [Labilibaculum antarcticum]BAX78628.1 aminotransferase DegT [Labilibaculum antarcticum]
MINYPLATSSWGDEEIDAIQKVISTGMFSMGKHVSQFEKEFAQHFGSKYSVMVNSGSSANLLAVAALFFKQENPLKAGDEVIVPSVSWSTTYHPLQQYGLKLKFVDVDIETLNISVDALKEAITDKTRAIFLVNLLGNPNEFERINELIKDRDIYLLEDNCESMGAEFHGQKTGTFGLLGTYSTFFSHHISTMEGGMITTDDEELFHILLSIRAHGWTRNLPEVNRVTGQKDTNAFLESFKFVLPGYNVRPIEMSGAVGTVQLSKLNDFVQKRRSNAEVFIEELQNQNKFILQKEIGLSSWFGFSFIVNPEIGISREFVMNKLQSSGVEVRPIVAGDFTKNPVIKYFDYEIHGVLINSQRIDRDGFFIGNHHIDLQSEIRKIGSLLKSI